MGKLRQIINQLGESDYESLCSELKKKGAAKSVFLLQAMRIDKFGDRKIMQRLDMHSSTYYTICSRLSQKIESHLLAQIETPHTLLLRKVASLHELVFNSSRVIVWVALKKLEKELISYDLSVELISIYKHLKRLSIHTKWYTTYASCYDRQVNYMFAMDKSETLLTNYFRVYGHYYLQGKEEQKLSLCSYKSQLKELLDQYDSHKLYVNYAALMIFHRLYVEDSLEDKDNENEPTEDVFERVGDYFKQYEGDPVYPHYVLLFNFLKLAYYHRYGIERKVDHLCDSFSDDVPHLLSNYNSYTFPSHVFWIMLSYSLRNGTLSSLKVQNDLLFAHYDPDVKDLANYLGYVSYRSICCYYAGEYQEAATWIQQTFNQVIFRSQAHAQVELKALLALQYALLDRHDLFTQVISSLQRHLRLLDKSRVLHLTIFAKILKISMQEYRKAKGERIKELIKQMPMPSVGIFSPLASIRLDSAFIERLAKVQVAYY